MNPIEAQAMPEPSSEPSCTRPRPKRPVPLNLMGWVFALWTLLGWLRFGGALEKQHLLTSLVGPGLYFYLLLAGLVWGGMGLPVLWGLLTRAAWAPAVLLPAAILYPALYWLERLLLWQNPHAHRNWPFFLLLTAAWAGLVWWGLRSAQRCQFFKK
ncbi:MAG: hypothetical protein GX142_03700 [Chloroflexi bacterium]|nr:hypothetical protein [Chloroflexota bacterium]